MQILAFCMHWRGILRKQRKLTKKKNMYLKNAPNSHVSMAQWQSGGLQTQSMLVRTQAVFFGFLRPWHMNVNLRRLECFTSYLHNGQSGNLRAIENCICGLRSIERNMRAFLRTVQ
jgi:hypothetical protein